MKLNAVILGIIYFAVTPNTYAGNVISEVPDAPDASDKYIFYLHGSIEESEGETEKYEMAVNAIAESSATVIAEVRGNTDPNTYAEKVKTQVNQLISKGVSASNITISGFSKGSIIALASSGVINNPEINYVLLAGCSIQLNEKYSIDPTKAAGRILSIYDSSDKKFGSCDGIVSSSDKVKYEEIELDSGKGHKVFRIPKDKFIEQWRDPLVDWADA